MSTVTNEVTIDTKSKLSEAKQVQALMEGGRIAPSVGNAPTIFDLVIQDQYW